jgi:hypothetical protein
VRAGGGAEKGAAFERDTGKRLSLWITEGARSDLFSRNVLSGGKFTLATQKGLEKGMPGDLMAAHPLAFEFLSHFLIECKHHADLKLEHFLFDFQAKGHIASIIAKARMEAASMNLYYMVIAAQNRRPALVFMQSIVGLSANLHAKPRKAFRYHKFHNDTIFCCTLDDLLAYVKIGNLIAALPPLKGPAV